jgi:hypothetical protein
MMITMLINALVALNRIGDFLTKSESGLASLRTAAEGMPAGHIKVGSSCQLGQALRNRLYC